MGHEARSYGSCRSLPLPYHIPSTCGLRRLEGRHRLLCRRGYLAWQLLESRAVRRAGPRQANTARPDGLRGPRCRASACPAVVMTANPVPYHRMVNHSMVYHSMVYHMLSIIPSVCPCHIPPYSIRMRRTAMYCRKRLLLNFKRSSRAKALAGDRWWCVEVKVAGRAYGRPYHSTVVWYVVLDPVVRYEIHQVLYCTV